MAYRRAMKVGVHGLRSEFVDCGSEEQWLTRAEEIGLLPDLRRFKDGWLADDSDKLVIWYGDLIEKPKEVVTAVQSFFRLPVSSEPVVLAKARYTRLSLTTRMSRAARRFLGAVLRKIGLYGIAKSAYTALKRSGAN